MHCQNTQASKFLLKKQDGVSNSCNKSMEEQDAATSTVDKLETPNIAVRLCSEIAFQLVLYISKLDT